MKKSLIILALAIASCSKAPIVDVEPAPRVKFTYTIVEDGPDKGLTMPSCGLGYATHFYIKYRYLSGGSGSGYFSLDGGITMQQKTVHVEDFKVLDQDRNVLYRMPRAYNGKAFVFYPQPKGTIVGMPVSCNETAAE